MHPSMHNLEQLFGRIALHWKFIDEQQWNAALAAQQRVPGTLVGDILLRQGVIDATKLTQLRQAAQQMSAQQDGAPAANGAAGASQPEARHRPPSAAAQPGPQQVAAVGWTIAADAAPRARSVRPAEPSAASTLRQSGRLTGASPAAASSPAQERLHQVMAAAVERQASDLQLHAGLPPMLRIDGQLCPYEGAPLSIGEARDMAMAALQPTARIRFEEAGEVDMSYSLAGVARFRGNVFRHRRGVDASFRVVPATIPALEDLGLPAGIRDFTHLHQGMVLFTGPAGCGKSTTMAAMIDVINQDRADHILTVEDPIEFVHPSKRCQVNQREVGQHTASFARALKGALREDPDVIAIGELRDLETISLALTAAETGHLVFATMHTNSAISTLNRLIGVFPPGQQGQIRGMVGESLKGVVVQKLANRREGNGRVPVLEILRLNMAVANLVREQKTSQIENVLQTGTSHGMCYIDGSLNQLLRDQIIDRDEALRLCADRNRIARS